ncbi:hypothetical protein G7K_5902-t1 [Saitoella complicata NRRL Y-17804]|uniref:Uncharacterized protein n=1 Tax=Saitoella complicata (strain BCRC 22490 / CBS 7301 / JCM 7358 / NBRC 10748 / NRRL Y-17804) TaxID=698492 RepID=A0A0E9NQ39_SAICN|nr:hypothetical protein G7K_5902-t1 [Saitoella complicata NRRL Y-17804]
MYARLLLLFLPLLTSILSQFYFIRLHAYNTFHLLSNWSESQRGPATAIPSQLAIAAIKNISASFCSFVICVAKIKSNKKLPPKKWSIEDGSATQEAAHHRGKHELQARKRYYELTLLGVNLLVLAQSHKEIKFGLPAFRLAACAAKHPDCGEMAITLQEYVGVRTGNIAMSTNSEQGQINGEEVGLKGCYPVVTAMEAREDRERDRMSAPSTPPRSHSGPYSPVPGSGSPLLTQHFISSPSHPSPPSSSSYFSASASSSPATTSSSFTAAAEAQWSPQRKVLETPRFRATPPHVGRRRTLSGSGEEEGRRGVGLKSVEEIAGLH